LETAAKAWNSAEEVVEEATEEAMPEEVVEEATEEAMPEEEVVEEVAEEVVEEESEGAISCPICSTENASDSSACSACGFSF